MRRSTFTSQREAGARNGRNGHNNTNNSSSSSRGSSTAAGAAAATRAWVQPRLVHITTQLLTQQPSDPLRVLAGYFAMEGLLLSTYPEPPAQKDGKERMEADELGEDGGGSRRSSPTPAGQLSKPASKAKTQTGSGDMRPASAAAGASAATLSPPVAADSLLEHGGLRRLLQPYGLHAVARSVCPAVGCTTEQQHHWMECFALLHRQSRLSAPERAAASRRAALVGGWVLPPVDFRAAEELPAPLVLLYLLVVMEVQTESSGSGPGAAVDGGAAAAFVRLRTQLSKQVLALVWWAALTQHEQPGEGSERSDSSSSSGDKEAVQTAPPSSPHLLLDILLRLSPAALESFHQWLQRYLRSALLSPAKAATTTTTTVGSAVPRGEGTEDLAALHLHVAALLQTVLDTPAAVGAMPAVVSVDVFTALMPHVVGLAAALDTTAAAMAATLCGRVPRGAVVAGATGEGMLRWATALLKRCAAHLERTAAPEEEEATTSASPSRRPALPPVWAMYVEQLSAFLPAQLTSMALIKKAGEAFSESPLAQTWPQLPCTVGMSALAQEWVARVFAAHSPVPFLLSCAPL